MTGCTECAALDGGTTTGMALFAGVLVACPCHLPISLAVLAGVTGGAALAWGTAVWYTVFSLLFVGLIVAAFLWLLRARDKEVALEEHKQRAHDASA